MRWESKAFLRKRTIWRFRVLPLDQLRYCRFRNRRESVKIFQIASVRWNYLPTGKFSSTCLVEKNDKERTSWMRLWSEIDTRELDGLCSRLLKVSYSWDTAMAMLSWLWFALLSLLVVHSSLKSSIRTSAGESVIEQSNWENNRAPANCSNTIPEGSRNHTTWEMRPFPSEASYQFFNETRRKLGTFQICSLCTCCGGRHHLCLPSPCCYAINCNIPNRPFGLCSFTPKACNCFGCHLWYLKGFFLLILHCHMGRHPEAIATLCI